MHCKFDVSILTFVRDPTVNHGFEFEVCCYHLPPDVALWLVLDIFFLVDFLVQSLSRQHGGKFPFRITNDGKQRISRMPEVPTFLIGLIRQVASPASLDSCVTRGSRRPCISLEVFLESRAVYCSKLISS